jgi:lactoylglutathione lyase
MYIDHIAIYTKDPERLRAFYVRYFSGTANEKYRNDKTGLETYFISFESRARLEIMFKPQLSEEDRSNKMVGLTHLCFKAGSREKVDELTNRLTVEGYLLKSPPRNTGDGYYESCVLDPDCNEVEIVA